MDGRINVTKAPEIMVSHRPPNPVEKANTTWIPRANSPLEKTPHKARNGDLSITCRNRHCPKCQGAARQKWLASRTAELLPVPYFHVVFTLPHLLAPLALQNKQVLYGILFRAVSETLLEVAADPKHLGADIGFLTVLHTWGQNLSHHPHIHCVVPGGGLSSDRSRWIGSGDRFLLPLGVLSRVFRGKFLAFLRKAVRQGKLQFHGALTELATRRGFGRLLKKAYGCEWVVYTKPPFGRPEHVLRNLARYTHRVAISNHRIVSIADGQVTFLWKDYAHGNQQKKMTVAAAEFLRRFFQHVLPKGFVRIRHFGFPFALALRGCVLHAGRAARKRRHRRGSRILSAQPLGARAGSA